LYNVQRHIIMFRLSDLAGMTRNVALQSIHKSKAALKDGNAPEPS